MKTEHLLLADVGKRVPLRFRVEYIEYLGAERILYGALEGGRFPGKAVASRIPSGVTERYEANSVHDFIVPESELKFFDRASEKRVAPKAIPWQ